MKNNKINSNSYVIKPISRFYRSIINIISILIYVISIYYFFKIHHSIHDIHPEITWVFPIFITYLFSKLLLSNFYKKSDNKYDKNEKVVALIPFYNEDLESVQEQLKTLRNQSYSNIEIWYIDDHSKSMDVYHWLDENLNKENEFLIRNDKNMGKRESQVAALKLVKDADYIYTTDSDSILLPNTIYELLRAIDHDDVAAVSGVVVASNAKKNLLTRLLNVRYFNAFESERAAQSATHSVLVNSGPNSMYRAHIIYDNLQEYQNQYFLGKKQYFGDDRALTNISLRYGKVKYQSSSVVYTEVPQNMTQFTKQQIRWGKSFIRESYVGLKNGFKNKLWVVSLWILLEILIIPVYYYTITYSIVSVIFGFKYLVASWFLLISVFINSWLRNFIFIKFDFVGWLLSPIYGFIHILWVTPLKVYSLLKIKDNGWGTR